MLHLTGYGTLRENVPAIFLDTLDGKAYAVASSDLRFLERIVSQTSGTATDGNLQRSLNTAKG